MNSFLTKNGKFRKLVVLDETTTFTLFYEQFSQPSKSFTPCQQNTHLESARQSRALRQDASLVESRPSFWPAERMRVMSNGMSCGRLIAPV